MTISRKLRELNKSTSLHLQKVLDTMEEKNKKDMLHSSSCVNFSSLTDVIADAAYIEVFMRFLTEDLSEENLCFWLQVNEYKQMPQRSVADDIYNTYIKNGAEMQVNISHKQRSRIEAELSNHKVDLFDEAQREIRLLIERDSLEKFKASIHHRIIKTLVDKQNSPIRASDFKVHAILSSNNFESYLLVEKKGPCTMYVMRVAMKQIWSETYPDTWIKKLEAQRDFSVKASKSSWLMGAQYAFQTQDHACMVFPVVIWQLKLLLGRMTERMVLLMFCELLLAVDSLHQLGHYHGDLSVDKVFLDENGQVILLCAGVTFGFKRHKGRTSPKQDFLDYSKKLSEEEIEMKQAADWWSLGLMMYNIVCGHAPYPTHLPPEIWDEKRLHFSEQLSQEFQEVLRGLLTLDKTKRLGGQKQSFQEISQAKLFEGISWHKMATRQWEESDEQMIAKLFEENEQASIHNYLKHFQQANIDVHNEFKQTASSMQNSAPLFAESLRGECQGDVGKKDDWHQWDYSSAYALVQEMFPASTGGTAFANPTWVVTDKESETKHFSEGG